MGLEAKMISVGALPKAFWMISAVALASGAGEWKITLARVKKHRMRPLKAPSCDGNADAQS